MLPLPNKNSRPPTRHAIQRWWWSTGISGVYGDVQRVKILYNKKDSALIQMAEPHQAYLGELNEFYLIWAYYTKQKMLFTLLEGIFWYIYSLQDRRRRDEDLNNEYSLCCTAEREHKWIADKLNLWN